MTSVMGRRWWLLWLLMLSPLATASIELTDEEQRWLDAHPRIVLGISSQFQPDIIVHSDGRQTGLVVDYMALLNAQLGNRLTLHVEQDWAAVTAKARRGEIDGLAVSAPNPTWDRYFHYTEPFYYGYLHLYVKRDATPVRRLEDLSGKRVGYLAGMKKVEHVIAEIADVDLQSFATFEQLAKALLEDQLDTAIGLIDMEWWRKQNSILGIAISGLIETSRHPVLMSIRQDWPLLPGILNKALNAIPAAERERIQRIWLKTTPTEQGTPVALSAAQRAWLDAHPDIVLGMSDQWPPSLIRDANGQLSGIMIDALDLLNRRLGTAIRLQVDSDWPQLIEDARARRIDGLLAVAPLPIWDDAFRLTNNYYTTHLYLYTKDGNTLTGTDLDALAGQRVGWLQGHKLVDAMLAPVADQIERVEFAKNEDMATALLDGRIDLAVATGTFDWWRRQNSLIGFGLAGILEDSETQFAMAIRQDWAPLVEMLNRGLASITATQWRAIINRWVDQAFLVDASPRLNLSQRERAWLADHPVIRYTVQPNRAPVEFVDRAGGPSGMSAEYLERLAKLLGVRFEFVPVASWSEALEMIRSGEIDLLPTAALTPERQTYLTFTEPYLHLPIAIFAPMDAAFYGTLEMLEGKRVAVLQRSAAQDMLGQDYPNLPQVEFVDTNAALRAVQRGEVDAFVESLLTVSYIISRDGLTHIRMAGNTQYSFDLRMAVRHELAPLAAILDQALAAIPQFEQDAIQHRWMKAPPPARIDYQLLWQVLGVSTLIVIIMLYWNRRLSTARAALQRSKNYYQALIASMAEGMIVHQANGQIAICNQSAERILGVPRAQLLGLNIFDWQWQTNDEHGRPLASTDYPVMTTLRTGEPQYGFLMGITTPSNEQRWLLINTQPLYVNGTPPRLESVIATFTDISERRRLEQDLRRIAAAAEAASQAKSAFLATVSHEIRTPMNAVLGMLYLCLETELTSRQRGYLQQAHRAAKSLLELLNNILDFSKVEAGKLKLEQIPFSLAGVLSDVDTVVGSQAKAKGLAFHIQRPAEVPDALLGDPLRLSQVLINLTNNAVKFTPQGSVDVIVRLRTHHLDSARIYFAVRDSGIGIESEQLTSLFQHFHQADSSTTRRYGGTGLGLSISQQLVELMGGRIQVASQVGTGSVFSFSLPFQLAPAECCPEAIVHSSNQALAYLAGKRVLVVEDHVVNCQVICDILASAGMVVSTAAHGQAALHQIATLGLESWDLILMDIQMPELDGLETTRRIRARADGAKIPIIGLSAHARAENLAESLTAGMNAHLAKPIDPPSLFSELAHWLTPMAIPPPAPAASALAPPRAPLTPATLNGLSTQLARLHDLASSYDTALEDAFADQRQQFADLFPDNTLSELAHLIDRYRFDEAAALLEQLRGQLATLRHATPAAH